MPANRRRYNPLKDSSDIFSEEYQTAAEKLMDNFAPSSGTITDEDLRDLPKLKKEICYANPKLTPQQAEAEILELLDKFYNGDRDVPPENRYQNKNVYKHLLIDKFQRWGLVYVEKKHYALSRPEKHLIRMDFYGTVNKPRKDQTSDSYRKNENIFINPPKNRSAKSAIKKSDVADNQTCQYNLEDYNLETSAAWRLMRTFPRFHTLENKIRIQMQQQGVNPEIIPYLNIYDYSDLLYNHFKQQNDKNDDCATIFLGARQSFVKDVFLKNEAWLRTFFKRQNYNERYVEALIKSAQSRGVTGNIELKSNTKDFIADYIRLNRQQFSGYLRLQAQSGNHIKNIIEQLENLKEPLNDEMRGYIYQNEGAFRNHFKHKHITSRLTHAVFELLSSSGIPQSMKETLKGFATQNESLYRSFLQQQGFEDSEIQNYIKHLKTRFANDQDYKLITAFAKENLPQFRDNLTRENRDENYIRFAENTLTPPPIPEYMQESLYKFILSQDSMPTPKHSQPTDLALFNKVREDGHITPENYDNVRQYVLKHRQDYSSFYKRNNIFTYQELNEQYTDITNFLIKTRGLPNYAQKSAQNFITGNVDIFRYWYANFQQQKYQLSAEKHFEHLKKNGLTPKDTATVSQFIFQRLDVFAAFCENNGSPLTQDEIRKLLQSGNLFKNKSTQQFDDFRKQTEQFILQNGYAFRRMIVQKQIEQKEKEADIIIQKISKQGITPSLAPIAHKFVLNNKHLFSNSLFNSSEDNDYAMGILTHIRKGNISQEMQSQVKSFILRRKKSFEDYIRSEESIEKYITNTLEQIDRETPSADTSYWSIKFITQNQENFENYLTGEKIGEDNVRMFMDKIQTENLAKNIKMTFGKNGISLHFNDEMSIAFPKLSVHHKCAVQDSFEQITPDNLSSASLASPAQSSYDYPNLAAANYFNNLCLIIDDPYHIRFFHGMDSTEKFDNCERYIARLYPADPNVIFFGSLAAEDQLSYDYSQDPRTIRYRKHTEKMRAANQEASKKHHVSSDMSFFVITGSRQGRR